MLAKRFQDAAGLQAGEKTMISYLESLRGLAAESEGCVQAEINWFFMEFVYTNRLVQINDAHVLKTGFIVTDRNLILCKVLICMCFILAFAWI